MLAVTAALALSLVACREVDDPSPHSSDGPGPRGPAAAAALSQLDALRVIPVRPDVPGYERSCEVGRACSFGPAWSDDVDVAGGHNGCDTRNDVLAAQLREVQYRPGSTCVVVAGVLDDPYTGERIEFRKADASQVPVDHVIPLAMAWDLGAADWTPDQRKNFANDPTGLQLTGRASNSAKGDSGPSEWMPATVEGRCGYATRYVAMAAQYELPMPSADASALHTALAACP
jgi:hypothetical protein